jgi:hypothetical protein
MRSEILMSPSDWSGAIQMRLDGRREVNRGLHPGSLDVPASDVRQAHLVPGSDYHLP